MSENTLPDSETINDYVVSALGEVDALNAGAYDWRTSMPYRDDDSDVIISNAVHCVKPLLTRVENLQSDLAAARERAEQAEEEAARLRAALEGVLMHCAKNPLDVNDTDGNRLNGVKLHTRKALGKPLFED